jgi:hypothetical protein
MGDERKYQVWGYPAKSDPNLNYQGKWIGSADDSKRDVLAVWTGCGVL